MLELQVVYPQSFLRAGADSPKMTKSQDVLARIAPRTLTSPANLTDPFIGPMRLSRHRQLLTMSVERT
jgi:hypothetical protein